MSSDNKLAAFYRALSEKNEREGSLEKALENLRKARDADDGNAEFYAAEEARLRGLLRSFDPALFEALAKAIRDRAVLAEDFSMYEKAEERARELAERAAGGDPEALCEADRILGRPREEARAGSAPASAPVPTPAGRASGADGQSEGPGPEALHRILREYYQSEVDALGPELQDVDGSDLWDGTCFAMLDPSLIGPHEQEVRSGDTSGLAAELWRCLSGKGALYGSVLKVLLEMCQNFPCCSDPDSYGWYYDRSLEYLEQARAAGAIGEKLYQKIRKNVEKFPPAELMRIDEKTAYREKGLCQYCGGTFEKTLFSWKCTRCGRKKDY